MTSVNVTATRWARGWELEIGEYGHSQVRKLANARQQAIDFLDTIQPEIDHSTWNVTIIPALDGLSEQIAAAKAATIAAAKAQEDAAVQSRNVVKKLLAAGVSGTDTAVIMGVTKSRISQLAKG